MSDPVVVLGMHRSGTSFLVRTLNLAGLWLGGEDKLHTVEGRAKIGNPKGNYENVEGIAINDAILTRSGGTWYNPPKQLVATPDDTRRIVELCTALRSGQPEGYLRWGWKDPRTVLTLDIWLQTLKSNIFIVGSYRHPSAVAQSLAARDGIPLEVGYGLWGVYVHHLLHHIRKHPYALVRFDVDPEHLLEQVSDVCRRTGLRADKDTISSWYDPKLVRSETTADDDSPMFRRVAPLWEELLALHERQN
ncbi:MAG: sulfotransferase family protein [Gammaproteobacteria bacterium]|nr:sulfotransferase family protein [Gammaproteobacteria bacterium]